MGKASHRRAEKKGRYKGSDFFNDAGNYYVREIWRIRQIGNKVDAIPY